MKDGTRQQSCLNCSAPLSGPYCSQCGQKVTDLQPSLRELTAEFSSGLFTLDSRIFRTLKVLLTRPGLLTEEYNEGKRVSYVSPLRLYLAISVLLFFILAITDAQVFKTTVSPETQSRAEAGTTADTERPPVVLTLTGIDEETGALEAGESDSETYSQRAVRAAANPRLMNSMIVERLPQALFLLVPVIALFVKVAYWRSHRVYAQHFVFVLHFNSFLFVLSLIVGVLKTTPLPDALPALLAFVTTPTYLGMSLHRVYGQSIFWTVLKTLGLGVGYLLTTGICILAVGLAMIYFI